MTDALRKLRAAFEEGLGVPSNTDFVALEYAKNDHWDSVAHMELVAAIERQFGIMMDTDDVIAMSSFTAAKELLLKYGIKFDA